MHHPPLRSLTLAVLSLALALPAFGGQTYSLEGFQSVQVESGIQVELSQGPFSVERTTDAAPSNLVVTVEDHTLRLGYRMSWTSWFFDGVRRNARFRVSLPELHSLELSGGAGVQLQYGRGNDLSFKLSGGSQAKGTVNAGRITAELSGGSGANFQGAASSLDLRASGGSWFRSPSYTVQDGTFQFSGGSGALLILSGSVSVDASGGSSLEFTGSPKMVHQSTSGGSSVRSRS